MSAGVAVEASGTGAGAGVFPAGGRTSRVEWVDRFLGSDPGLNRFLMALQAVCAIAAALGAAWLFVHLTHAMQVQTHGARLPAKQAAAVALGNHELLVIGELVAAIVAMLSSFGIMDARARGQLVSSLFVPLPLVGFLALGISLGHDRVPSLVLLAVIMAFGTYCRRFGPRGFLAGLLMFMGFFLGFFLSAAVTLSDLGWLTAEVGVGVVATLLVRFGLFYPRPWRALRRTQGSYAARSKKVVRLALEVFDGRGDPGAERKLARSLVRLNETALMIDAQLGDPDALPDGSAHRLHQYLFDAELAVTNIARFTEAMAHMALPEDHRVAVRSALVSLGEGRLGEAKATAGQLASLLSASEVPAGAGGAVAGEDRATGGDRATIVIPHRFAGSVVGFADALGAWMALGAGEERERSGEAFAPAVALFAGWLPGSAPASAKASGERTGEHLWERIAMPGYLRVAIQMGVAVGLAILVGVQISGFRFYWAVIAAFVTFMGTNSSGEQVQKALFRVVGTAVGIVIGSLAGHLVGGHSNDAIAVILVFLFFGMYLMRINYAFMVVAITVMVSMLYVQLDEFSNHLLLLRLAETSVGAALGIFTALTVMPLRTTKVLRVALRSHLEAVSSLVEHASARLLDGGGDFALRADARALDAAYQTLVATAQPLRRNFFGELNHHAAEALALAGASRNYARNLVADVEALDRLDPAIRADLATACAALLDSIAILLAAIDGPRDVTYTRAAALFDRAERQLERAGAAVAPGQLAIRDLKLIDGTFARVAEEMHLHVASHDTAAFA